MILKVHNRESSHEKSNFFLRKFNNKMFLFILPKTRKSFFFLSLRLNLDVVVLLPFLWFRFYSPNLNWCIFRCISDVRVCRPVCAVCCVVFCSAFGWMNSIKFVTYRNKLSNQYEVKNESEVRGEDIRASVTLAATYPNRSEIKMRLQR